MARIFATRSRAASFLVCGMSAYSSRGDIGVGSLTTWALVSGAVVVALARRDQLRSVVVGWSLVGGAGCELLIGKVFAFWAQIRESHVAEVDVDVDVESDVLVDVEDDVEVDVDGRVGAGTAVERVKKGILTGFVCATCFGVGFGSCRWDKMREGRTCQLSIPFLYQ
jgi:hypothetical protein